MKKIFLTIIGILLISIAVCTKDDPKTRTVIPKNSKNIVKTIVGGKEWNYFPLHHNNSTVLQLEGPGKLKIISRIRFTNKEEDDLEYSIIYRINGSEKRSHTFTDVVQSQSACYLKGKLGIPGVEGDVFINIPSGENSVEVWKGKDTHRVAVRFLFTPHKEKKAVLTPLTPSSFIEPVDLVNDERITVYYRFSESAPLKLSVIGPTKLKLLTRLEYTSLMKGRISYRICVKEDGKTKNSFSLCGIKSESAEYKKKGGLIPGKANEIYINVPKGLHNYEIVPLDKELGTIIARVLFPKKDVKLEK